MRTARELFRDLFHLKDRRAHDVAVIKERRKPSLRESEDRLKVAISKLEETVRTKRQSFIDEGRTLSVMNGVKRIVQFDTFADICRHAGPKDFTVRLCRHPEHPASGTGIAKCDAEACPEMRKAIK